MDKESYGIGDRIEKMCAVCGEERGHTVARVTKRGQPSLVICAKCNTSSAFRLNQALAKRSSPIKISAPYDRARTYRAGHTMLHPAFGEGEVMTVVEGQKIDVLFADRMRRLIHALA